MHHHSSHSTRPKIVHYLRSEGSPPSMSRTILASPITFVKLSMSSLIATSPTKYIPSFLPPRPTRKTTSQSDSSWDWDYHKYSAINYAYTLKRCTTSWRQSGQRSMASFSLQDSHKHKCLTTKRQTASNQPNSKIGRKRSKIREGEWMEYTKQRKARQGKYNRQPSQ